MTGTSWLQMSEGRNHQNLTATDRLGQKCKKAIADKVKYSLFLKNKDYYFFP